MAVTLLLTLLKAIPMLRNYIKIAWRNLIKEKGYTVINLTGLSVAIAFVVLIALYIKMELEFDRFHTKVDQLYRVARITYTPDGDIREKGEALPMPLGPALTTDYPQIKEMTRTISTLHLMRHQGEFFQENGIIADRTFLQMFDFPLAIGNRESVLSSPNNIVISERLATKLGSDRDLVGTEIELNVEGNFVPFTISGIIKNPPANSTIRFDFLLPMDWHLQTERGRSTAVDWTSSYLETYVVIDKQENLDYLNSQMVSFRNKYFPDHTRSLMERGLWHDSTKAPVTYEFLNVSRMHTEAGYHQTVNTDRYYQLGALAVIVLVLACINFTLLSIGKARRRSLEIGMRKAMGATKDMVVGQFWSESILTGLVAMVVAIVLIKLSIPIFNEAVTASISFDDFLKPVNVLLLFAAGGTTGMLAGIYPAFILSSYKPVDVMRQSRETGRSSFFSRALIAMQFGVSVFFIVMALVIGTQLDFVKNRDMGVETEGIIRMSVQGLKENDVTNYKNKLASYSFVKGMAGLRSPFPLYGNRSWSYEGVEYRGYILEGDRDFIDLFGIKFIEGSNFSETLPDSTNVIAINEAMAAAYPGIDLIDKPLPGYRHNSTVIGIVEDFYFQSAEHDVRPMVITINPYLRGVIRPRTTLLVKIDLTNVKENLKTIENDWLQMLPDAPFGFTFMREDLNQEYRAHERWGKIMIASALMTVFISCLGLIGFSTLFVNGKQKEIGIRKIMGSSSTQIFGMFTQRFLLLVVVGAAIAVPGAWYVANVYLEMFAFRIELSWTYLAAGVVIASATALLVVSYMLINISRLNPVNILREN